MERETEELNIEKGTVKNALQELKNDSAPCPKIEIQGQKISGEEMRALGKALEENPKATALHLSNIEFTGEGALALAEVLAGNATLARLEILNSSMHADGIKALAVALGKNQALSHLDFRWNNIGAKGAKALAHALEENATLRGLDLSGNRLGNEGAEAIAKSLPKNKGLQELNLKDNKIGASGVKSLDKALDTNFALNVCASEDSNDSILGLPLGLVSGRFEAYDEIKRKCQRNNGKHLIFLEAVKTGDLEKIKQCHNSGMPLTVRFNGALMMTGPKDKGNVVFAKDMTALHVAAREGHLGVVEYLLEHVPALLAAKNERGETAIDLARACKNDEILNCLLSCQSKLSPAAASSSSSYEGSPLGKGL